MTSLSILVPIYNEAATLSRVMECLALHLPDAQIIYVDDGSGDASLRILHEKKRPQDIVLTKQNGGKGSAIRMGLAHACGTFTTVQDADLEYDPREINDLLRTAATENLDAVFGSRFLKKNPNIYKRFLLGNKVMTWAINILFFSHLTDSYTCYKLLKTDLFRSFDMRANGFDMEAELCARCIKAGIRIKEIPISYAPRTIAEGKKIGWRDVWRGLKMMIRIRFS